MNRISKTDPKPECFSKNSRPNLGAKERQLRENVFRPFSKERRRYVFEGNPEVVDLSEAMNLAMAHFSRRGPLHLSSPPLFRKKVFHHPRTGDDLIEIFFLENRRGSISTGGMRLWTVRALTYGVGNVWVWKIEGFNGKFFAVFEGKNISFFFSWVRKRNFLIPKNC